MDCNLSSRTATDRSHWAGLMSWCTAATLTPLLLGAWIHPALADPLLEAPLTYSVGSEPFSIAVGDLNGDGFVDLATANASAPTGSAVTVLYGNGDLTFAQRRDCAAAAGRQSVAMGDLNGDGMPDLATANYSSGTVTLLFNHGTAGFTSFTFTARASTGFVALGDLNNDGRPDIAATNDDPGNGISIWLTRPDGFPGPMQFYPTSGGPNSLAIADVNHDGFLDILTANFLPGPGTTVTVWLGNGSGALVSRTDFPLAVGGAFSIAVGDANADGNPDIAVSHDGYGTFSLLFGDGTGGFSGETEYGTRAASFAGGLSLRFGDLNADGALDVALAARTPGVVYVFLGNGDGTFQGQRSFFAGDGATAVSLVDIDGDGVLDMAVADQFSNAASILGGNGDGSFPAEGTFPTGSRPRWVAVGDLNNDGRADLFTANLVGNSISVGLGLGNGTFRRLGDTALGGNSLPVSAASADFDRDGKLDIAVANQGNGTVSVLLGKGDGTFKSKTNLGAGKSPTSLAVGDFNRDGRPDIVVSVLDESAVSVLLGTGGGGGFKSRVKYDTATFPSMVSVSDVNGDSFQDLVVAARTSTTVFSVLLGNGDGTFQPHRDQYALDGTFSIAIGDLNADGRPDLVPPSSLYDLLGIGLGLGDGSFATPATFYRTGVHPRAAAVSDFNGDGRLDVAVANFANSQIRQTNSSVSLFPGNGDGTLQPRTDYAAARGPISLAVADFNGDGTPDIAAASFTANRVSILLNGGGSLALAAPAPSVPLGSSRATGQDASVSPNPMNPEGSLSFVLSRPEPVKVRLFDIHGRLVRTLLDEPLAEAGSHSVKIDGHDGNGRTLPSGVYFYRIEAAGEVTNGRFTIMK